MTGFCLWLWCLNILQSVKRSCLVVREVVVKGELQFAELLLLFRFLLFLFSYSRVYIFFIIILFLFLERQKHRWTLEEKLDQRHRKVNDVPQTWFVGPILSLPEVCQVSNHPGVTVCNCVSDDLHSNMTWFHFSFHDTICNRLHYFCGAKDRQKASSLSEAVCPSIDSQSAHQLILSLKGILKPWKMMTESRRLAFAQEERFRKYKSKVLVL